MTRVDTGDLLVPDPAPASEIEAIPNIAHTFVTGIAASDNQVVLVGRTGWSARSDDSVRISGPFAEGFDPSWAPLAFVGTPEGGWRDITDEFGVSSVMEGAIPGFAGAAFGGGAFAVIGNWGGARVWISDDDAESWAERWLPAPDGADLGDDGDVTAIGFSEDLRWNVAGHFGETGSQPVMWSSDDGDYWDVFDLEESLSSFDDGCGTAPANISIGEWGVAAAQQGSQGVCAWVSQLPGDWLGYEDVLDPPNFGDGGGGLRNLQGWVLVGQDSLVVTAAYDGSVGKASVEAFEYDIAYGFVPGPVGPWESRFPKASVPVGDDSWVISNTAGLRRSEVHWCTTVVDCETVATILPDGEQQIGVTDAVRWGDGLLIAGLELTANGIEGRLWLADPHGVKSSTTQGPTRTSPPATESSPTTAPITTAPPPASGSWIAVVASVPVGQSDTESRVSELVSANPALRSLVSDGYASLGAGYVVVYSGTFATSSDAIDACYEMGRTTKNECYAALLSQDPADKSNRVYP